MRKYLFLVLIAGVVVYGSVYTASSPERTLAADAGSSSNKAVVAKFMDAELRGDTAAMSALMSDDYVQYGLGVHDSADKAKTLEGVRHHWEVYKYGGKRYHAIETIAISTAQDGGRGRGKGDWVFVWGDMETDYPSTPEYGDKATTAEFAYHAAFRVKNGRIDTRTVYFNHEDIMRQLGYKMISVAEQQKHEKAGLVLK